MLANTYLFSRTCASVMGRPLILSLLCRLATRHRLQAPHQRPAQLFQLGNTQVLLNYYIVQFLQSQLLMGQLGFNLDQTLVGHATPN
jgi:hypothetical protein